MKRINVRYRLKAEHVQENEELIQKVFRQLHELNPPGIHYAIHKLADGVTFLHNALYETDGAHHLFTALSAFMDFQKSVKERCDELPVVSNATQIGAYSPR